MSTINKVTIGRTWTLVYDASVSGPFFGAVYCTDQDPTAYRIATSQPADTDAGMSARDWVRVALSETKGEKLYAKTATPPSLVVLDPSMSVTYPPWLLTSEKENIARLQVDVGNTGFFDAREFRYFREFDIPTGQSWWIRVITPPDGIILRTQSATVEAGRLRFRAWRDLTIDATFNAPGTPADAHTNDNALCSGIFGQNSLPSAPAYTRLTQITQSVAEVSVSGGTCSEAKRIRTSGATAQQISVGLTTDDERGIAQGTFWLELQSRGTANAEGVYDLKFEERTGQG